MTKTSYQIIGGRDIILSILFFKLHYLRKTRTILNQCDSDLRKKSQPNPYSITYNMINSKWIQDLNTEVQAIIYLEEIIQ